MNDRTMRWGGAAGVLFVILLLISVFAGGSMPKPDDSTAKVAKYFFDHRGGLLLANFVGLVGIPFALWFAVVLREAVRGDDRVSGAYSTVLLIGLAVTAPMAMVGGVLSVAPIYVKGAAAHLEPGELRLIFDAQLLAFAATSAGITTFAAGSAAALQRSGRFPAYTMWLALLAVVGNIVTMFATLGPGAAAIGFAGVLTFALFILVTGLTMAAGKVASA